MVMGFTGTSRAQGTLDYRNNRYANSLYCALRRVCKSTCVELFIKNHRLCWMIRAVVRGNSSAQN